MEHYDITLTDGFWHDLYTRNAEVTVYAVQKQFENTGRFEALRFTHAEKPDIPLHIFFDSDVAKWIEAVAYLLEVDRQKYADLEEFCDALIAPFIAHQREDGYLNSYFLQTEPERIFTNRGDHELYCAGHLTEAAIAYDRATGKRELLTAMEKMMMCIKRAFITENTAKFKTSGHEELKIALLRLYDYTGNVEYLEMAKHFLFIRGMNEEDKAVWGEWATKYYHQDDGPVREIYAANGHAVRACYLYTAMAACAERSKDSELLYACQRIYDDITASKMYITGGVGSSKTGEAFATPYTLPNSTAYSESCAAIAFMFFCQNMLEADRNAKYSDTIERIMYNGLLSSTSLSGDKFFYENPLEINLSERNTEVYVTPKIRQTFPITQRVECFNCSCCPPNTNRVMASIARYAYTKGEDRIYIEQFMPSRLDGYGLEVITDFPHSGSITLRGKGYKLGKLAIRVPSWCDNYSFTATPSFEDGYAVFDVDGDFEIGVSYPLTTKFVWANTKLFYDIGRVALTHGPIVYCIEGVDNGGTVTDLFVDAAAPVTEAVSDFQPLPEFIAKGARISSSDSLYQTARPTFEETELRFIPFYTFANRGESNMQVWVNELRFER